MPKRHDNDPLLQELGQRIRARREALGLTREGLGERLKTDSKNIYRLESGRENVGYVRLARIATALETELPQLTGRAPLAALSVLAFVQQGWTWHPPGWQPQGRGLEVLDLRPQAGGGVSQPEPSRLAWAEPPTELGATKGLFLAQIRGDSMRPDLLDGQWAIFARERELARGDRALVGERESTGLYSFVVKEVAGIEALDDERLQLVLRSRNRQWPDRAVTLDAGGDVAVLGVLVRALPLA